jgi:hypothetical protein
MLEFAARIWGARFGIVRAQLIEVSRWQRLRLGRSLALPGGVHAPRERSRSSDAEFVRLSTIELNREFQEKKEGGLASDA